MIQESRNEKRTSNFIRVNGTGTVAIKKGYRDVLVQGYFIKWGRWAFIVHRDTRNPELFIVSEASTGYRLKDETYYTIEDALYYTLSFIEEKRYYFATSVGEVLTKTQVNLFNRNTTNLQTLAIDTILWL